jgi:hypothetical protein
MTGQLAEDIWDRTTQTGQPGQVSLEGLAWMGKPGQGRVDRTART